VGEMSTTIDKHIDTYMIIGKGKMLYGPMQWYFASSSEGGICFSSDQFIENSFETHGIEP